MLIAQHVSKSFQKKLGQLGKNWGCMPSSNLGCTRRSPSLVPQPSQLPAQFKSAKCKYYIEGCIWQCLGLYLTMFGDITFHHIWYPNQISLANYSEHVPMIIDKSCVTKFPSKCLLQIHISKREANELDECSTLVRVLCHRCRVQRRPAACSGGAFASR